MRAARTTRLGLARSRERNSDSPNLENRGALAQRFLSGALAQHFLEISVVGEQHFLSGALAQHFATDDPTDDPTRPPKRRPAGVVRVRTTNVPTVARTYCNSARVPLLLGRAAAQTDTLVRAPQH